MAEELVFGRDQVGRLWVLLVGFVFGEGGWTRPVGRVLLAGQREGGGGGWCCLPLAVCATHCVGCSCASSRTS